tara:strand:- start:3898 stop:4407 length:510 start_codon:yes stop_codon:yes gene_type:complete
LYISKKTPVKLMNKVLRCLLIGLSCCLLAACEARKEFNLPKGDVEQGRATFILLQCNDCHSVASIPKAGNRANPLIDVEWSGDEAGDGLHVQLGGETTRIKSYADLLTSIVNPSHKLSRPYNTDTTTEDGKSRMRNYNDVMSVQDLIDLVAFLQDKYTVWVPEYYTWPP